VNSTLRNGKPGHLITYPTGSDRSYVTLQLAEYGIESENTEYKQLWRSDFLKAISAFANTGGGVLYIGLDDRGKPVGLRNALVSYGVLYISDISAKPIKYCLRTRCGPAKKILQKPDNIPVITLKLSEMHEIRAESKSDTALHGSVQGVVAQSDKLLDHLAEQCSAHDSAHDGEPSADNKASNAHDTESLGEQEIRLLKVINEAMSRAELMELLGLRHRGYFYNHFLKPLIEKDLVKPANSENVKTRFLKYKLTSLGRLLQSELKRKQ